MFVDLRFEQQLRGSTHYAPPDGGIIAKLLNGLRRYLACEDVIFARQLASLVRALATVGRAKIKIAPFGLPTIKQVG